MSESEATVQAEISVIDSIEAVPSILQVVCHATGMGFAAVARVTEGRRSRVPIQLASKPALAVHPTMKVPVNMFKLFADLIATHIDSTDRLASSEATLLDERQTAELREQLSRYLGTTFEIRSPQSTLAPSSSSRRLPTNKLTK